VDHRSGILNLPNEIAIGQNANHRDLARFRSENDRNFRPVVSRLQIFKRGIEDDAQRASPGQISVEISSVHGSVISPLLSEAFIHFSPGASSVLDLPFPPTKFFHGREAYLRHMDEYFFPPATVQKTQLVYAICGLGKFSCTA
jgi:hypothetical protein